MEIDRFFSVFKTASRGMSVQRQNLQVSAENIANAYTTRTEEGGAYKPKALSVQQNENTEGIRSSFQNTILKLQQTRNEHRDSNLKISSRQQIQDMGPQEEIIQQEKYRYEYDPEHPDSDENGMVQYPDLDMVEEMTNMISANRLYEANLAVVEAEKQVIKRSFEI